jgi:hypothetical protein
VAGICTFFTTYLRTPYKPVTFGLSCRTQVFTIPALLVLTIFTLIGVWSLLTFRAGFIGYSGDVTIERGRFSGSVTGFETVAYLFLVLPIFLLLISKQSVVSVIGWVMGAGFVTLSALNPWGRSKVVSVLLGISLVTCLTKRCRWPKPAYIVAVLLVTGLLQAQGHVAWDRENAHQFTYSGQELFDKSLRMFTGTDTAMLASWYVTSELTDNHRGYDYGLNTLNYILTGWIPNRYFPDKYFIIDWFIDVWGSPNNESYDVILYGSKPSLLGGFYDHGGLVGVILCMAFSGFLCRKLDGMLAIDSPDLVRALGVALMSNLWIIWGSHDFWAINSLGAVAMPAVFVWLVSKKRRRRRWRAIAVSCEQ